LIHHVLTILVGRERSGRVLRQYCDSDNAREEDGQKAAHE
jgi:hypothetical protein